MKTNSNKITCKNNLNPYPSEKTRWAYFMQAIEPTSQAINEAFPDYHPQWVQMSQQLCIDKENFKHMRMLLGMTKKQCAAYLRVSIRTVSNWENGSMSVPFSTFELLRMILESVRFKTSHANWDGWFIGNDGKLMSPDYGGDGYSPEKINLYPLVMADNAMLNTEVSRLKAKLDESVAENTKLRQMFVAQGVVDELATMQETIAQLMTRIATARVIPFQMPQEPTQEKVA